MLAASLYVLAEAAGTADDSQKRIVDLLCRGTSRSVFPEERQDNSKLVIDYQYSGETELSLQPCKLRQAATLPRPFFDTLWHSFAIMISSRWYGGSLRCTFFEAAPVLYRAIPAIRFLTQRWLARPLGLRRSSPIDFIVPRRWWLEKS